MPLYHVKSKDTPQRREEKEDLKRMREEVRNGTCPRLPCGSDEDWDSDDSDYPHLQLTELPDKSPQTPPLTLEEIFGKVWEISQERIEASKVLPKIGAFFAQNEHLWLADLCKGHGPLRSMSCSQILRDIVQCLSSQIPMEYRLQNVYSLLKCRERNCSNKNGR